jgi:hypothetical protein
LQLRAEPTAKLQAAEEAKHMLAQMELEDERMEEAVEESRQQFSCPNGQGSPDVVNSDGKFDLVASEKEVSGFPMISDQLLTEPGQSKRKERVEGQAELRKEIKAEVLMELEVMKAHQTLLDLFVTLC